eukprot:gene956-9863_t
MNLGDGRSATVCTFQQASKELKKNKKFIIDIALNDYLLQQIPKEFKNDREFILELVSKSGIALKFASDELKKDKEVVFKAVSQNGCAIEFASAELKKERDLVLLAISKNGYNLKFANDSVFKLEYPNIKENEIEDADMIFSYLVFLKHKYERIFGYTLGMYLDFIDERNWKNELDSESLFDIKKSDSEIELKEKIKRRFFHLHDVIDSNFLFFDIQSLVVNGDPKSINFNLFENETERIIWEDSKIGKIPNEIFQFSNLGNIQMIKCGIQGIPEELFKMKNLKEINFSQNQIQEISPNISNLKELQSLNLSHNLIVTIPESLFEMKNLMSLDLEHNLIKEISPNIINSNIYHLMLEGNNIWMPGYIVRKFIQTREDTSYDFVLKNPSKILRGFCNNVNFLFK